MTAVVELGGKNIRVHFIFCCTKMSDLDFLKYSHFSVVCIGFVLADVFHCAFFAHIKRWTFPAPEPQKMTLFAVGRITSFTATWMNIQEVDAGINMGLLLAF